MAKTRNLPHAERLPVAQAVGAGVRYSPDGIADHPLLLEVMFLDATGAPVMLPVRLTSQLAGAIGVQLQRNARTATKLASR